MQNDMLKNTIVPWQEKGRWYKLVGVYSESTSRFVTDANASDPKYKNITFGASTVSIASASEIVKNFIYYFDNLNILSNYIPVFDLRINTNGNKLISMTPSNLSSYLKEGTRVTIYLFIE